MDDVTVVNDMELGLAGNLSLVVEERPIKSNVVGLPFARSTRSVN